jgi:nucleoside-diphosphate-sugar epimerase
VIYGDGRQSRDFTYVANVVDANLRALTAKGLIGQAVNVACGKRVTVNELLRAVARQARVRPRARHEAPRPGDIRHSLADIRQARRLLGYRPSVGFDEGIRLTVDWYRSQGVR